MAKTKKKQTAPKASAANALDLSSLSVETVDEMPKVTRNSTKNNPFTAAVRDSYSDGNGRAVTVPGPLQEERDVKNHRDGTVSRQVTDGPAVRKVKYLLNQAAGSLNLGVRIITEEQDNGQVRVMFQGKDRKQRKAS